MPNVIGKRIKDARKTIEKAKLKVGDIEKKLSAESENTVIEQTPEAGKEVQFETFINLVIAKPETVKVPNLTGKKKEEVIKIIKSVKLKVGRILEMESREPPDTVIKQKPDFGEKVSTNTAVSITLSKP